MTKGQKPGNKARDWFVEGCELKATGKLSEAVIAFTAAIEREAGFAQAYFERGVCHYILGHYQQTAFDMDAASLLGCDEAQFWSKFGRSQSEDDDDQVNAI